MVSSLFVNKRTLGHLPLLFFSFFPYVSLYHTGTDVQPWGVLLASLFALFLFFKNNKFSSEVALLWIPFLYSLGLVFFFFFWHFLCYSKLSRLFDYCCVPICFLLYIKISIWFIRNFFKNFHIHLSFCGISSDVFL